MLLRNLRPKISGGSMSTRVISRVLASIRPLHCSSIVKHSFELKPTGWPPEGGKFCTTCYDKAINIPFKSLLKSSEMFESVRLWIEYQAWLSMAFWWNHDSSTFHWSSCLECDLMGHVDPINNMVLLSSLIGHQILSPYQTGIYETLLDHVLMLKLRFLEY